MQYQNGSMRQIKNPREAGFIMNSVTDYTITGNNFLSNLGR